MLPFNGLLKFLTPVSFFVGVEYESLKQNLCDFFNVDGVAKPKVLYFTLYLSCTILQNIFCC